MSNLRVADIIADSITDGPGLRMTVFVQGCPHRCEQCHNAQTWEMSGGKDMDTADIWRLVVDDPLVGGMTFSGGEPMEQAPALCDLSRLIVDKGLELAIYTGYTYEALLEKKDAYINSLLSMADVLIDGRYVAAKASYELKYKGSSNQRIIDLKKSNLCGSVILKKDGRWD